MRLLLLAALLLRLAPVPALSGPGEEHCARAGVELAHHVAAHHQAPHQAGPVQGDCPHCPPADCARQDQCTATSAMIALILAPSSLHWADATNASTHFQPTLLSVIRTPPTRPPSTLLA